MSRRGHILVEKKLARYITTQNEVDFFVAVVIYGSWTGRIVFRVKRHLRNRRMGRNDWTALAIGQRRSLGQPGVVA